MTFLLTEKINVGVSLCNYNAKVRWNVRGWDRVGSLGRDSDSFIWTPVCPEVASGLGVPRATVKLVGGNGQDFWQGKAKMKNKKGETISEQIKHGNLACLEILKRAQVEAFVFMEGSPSCGVYRTTLKNKRLGKPPGTFGELLLQENYFLIPAEDLESPVKWWDWRRRLQAFVWLKRQKIRSKKELYEIWHAFKFVCQEVDQEKAKEIGQNLANLEKKITSEQVEEWRIQVLKLLRQPSSYARIKAIIEKHFAHYNKHFKGKTEKVKLPSDQIGKHKFVEQLKQMEKRAITEDYDFGGTPVLFRGR
jgi:uncharacterized protein YbbK (DUF523 family)/uncharacterized protein YbgA (DUF1722 family)